MKKIFLLVSAGLSLFFCSCNTPSATNSTVEKEFINRSAIDSTVKPGDNFFLFADGKWLKNAVIGPTESRTGASLELFNRTKENLHSILDSLSKGKFAGGSIEQKTGAQIRAPVRHLTHNQTDAFSRKCGKRSLTSEP